MSELFLHLRITPDGYAVDGMKVYNFGHKIQVPGREAPDGVFAEWMWDGAHLRVRNDRYGVYPLYYFATAKEFAISTSIFQLLKLGASHDLDDSAMAAFLRLGFFLGEDTPFQAIRALPPNARLDWSAGKLSISGGLTVPKPREMDRTDAIDAYIELFRAAIRRRPSTRHPVIVPISGGRDSRHILLELCRQGAPPDHCVTTEYYPGPVVKTEIESATQLCQALGLRQTMLDHPETMFSAERRKNLATEFCAFEHTWFLVVADYLKQNARTVYDGIAGDMLSAGLTLTPRRIELFAQERYSEFAEEIFLTGSDRALENLLHERILRRFNRDLALARIESECRKHTAAANQVGSFHFWNRTRRLITLCPYRLMQDVPVVFSPYLDHELFDLLASLPAEMYVDHNFHTDTIKRAYPEYAHIPYAQSRKNDDGYQKLYQQLARETLRYLMNSGVHHWLRSVGLFSRLISASLVSRYSLTAEWLAPLALYFAQLNEVLESETGGQKAAAQLLDRPASVAQARARA